MSYKDRETEPLLGNRNRRQESVSSEQSVSVSVRSEDGDSGLGFIVKKEIRKQWNACCTVENLKSKFPISKWLPNYRLHHLQCDFIAGMTVGLTVIPQGLAYAKIANLPPQYGLYSAFMGCFVYCIFGTAKDITLGPTAIMSLMTQAFATSGNQNDATYAIVLCFMTGCVQFLMGILNLGILVNFISFPVINAFTSAAAITIGFGQVKGILGLKNIPRDFPKMVYETLKHIPDTNYWDLIMGVICILILYLLKKLRTVDWKDERDSSPTRCVSISRYIVWLVGTASNAIVVISASGVAAILISQGKNDTITLTGHVKEGLPPFRPPDFSVHNGNTTVVSTSQIFSTIGSGFAIVPLLGLVELIAIGKAFARQNNYKIQPSQELIAIGLANIISSFVGSYPVTGSFSRTAVNSQSGVKTPASGIFTGVLIVLALYVLTPLLQYIPKSALSAVIIFSVMQMVDYKVVIKLWRVNKLDLVPLVVTFVSCLAVSIEYGILIGIGVSLVILLYPSARPHVKVDKKEVKVLTLGHGLLFPAVEHLQERVLQESEADGKCYSIILDCSHVTSVDYSAIQGITELIADFERKDAKLVFAALPKHVYEHLQSAKIPDLLVSLSVDEGTKLIQEEMKTEFSDVNGVTVDVNAHL